MKYIVIRHARCSQYRICVLLIQKHREHCATRRKIAWRLSPASSRSQVASDIGLWRHLDQVSIRRERAEEHPLSILQCVALWGRFALLLISWSSFELEGSPS